MARKLTPAEEIYEMNRQIEDSIRAQQILMMEAERQQAIADDFTRQYAEPAVGGSDLQLGSISPVISFTYSPSSPIGPETLSFVNTSTDVLGAESYLWIGNGTTAATKNFTTIFLTTGSKTVSLSQTNSANIAGSTSQVITIAAPTLGSAFTITSGSSIAPVTLSFANGSTYDGHGTVAGTWTYGDGSTVAFTSSVNPPALRFDSGSFTASLQVTESSYTIKSITTKMFSLSAPTVTSNFTVDISSGAAPLNVTFSAAATTNGIGTLTYNWDFGSGSLTSTATNPTMSYGTAGDYNVTLGATESIYKVTGTKTSASFIVAS